MPKEVSELTLEKWLLRDKGLNKCRYYNWKVLEERKKAIKVKLERIEKPVWLPKSSIKIKDMKIRTFEDYE